MPATVGAAPPSAWATPCSTPSTKSAAPPRPSRASSVQPFLSIGKAPAAAGFNLAANGGYDFVHGTLQYAGVQATYNWNCCGLTFGYRRFDLGSIRGTKRSTSTASRWPTSARSATYAAPTPPSATPPCPRPTRSSSPRRLVFALFRLLPRRSAWPRSAALFDHAWFAFGCSLRPLHSIRRFFCRSTPWVLLGYPFQRGSQLAAYSLPGLPARTGHGRGLQSPTPPAGNFRIRPHQPAY